MATLEISIEAMSDVMTRRRALPATASMLGCLAVMTGCGSADRGLGSGIVYDEQADSSTLRSGDIVFAVGTEAPGIGFAIAGDTVKSAADRLIASGS